AEIDRPFDLRVEPPVRARLVRTGSARFVFLFTIHHIAADPWSVGIVARDLGHFYGCTPCAPTEAESGRGARRAPAPRIQYGDFARWQHEAFGDVLDERLAFWRERLDGAPSELALP